MKFNVKREHATVVKVAGCAECPFAGGDAADYCNLTTRKDDSTANIDVDYGVPAWCPLIRQRVELRLLYPGERPGRLIGSKS